MPIKIVAPSIELMSKAKLVVEGRARLRVPVARKPKTTNPAFEADVFYNPEMERNRSVSVEVLKAYQKKTRRDLRIADVFSGSGVRGIRYALEVPRVSLTAFNDLDAKALKLSRENARRSGVPARKAEFSQEDANVFLSTHSREKFHVVELDPFGSPAPFLENASRALVRHNGLLSVTATDLAALCGRFPQSCLQKYYAKPLHSNFMKETGIRILWAAVIRAFSVENIAVTPLLSFSAQHFFKAFALTTPLSSVVKKNLEEIGFLLQCQKCAFYETVKGFKVRGKTECPYCNSALLVAGPLWLGQLHDPAFLGFLDEGTATDAAFGSAREECGMPAFFFDVERFASFRKGIVPSPRKLVEQLKERGFKACRTQFSSTGVKTNAPLAEVEALLKRAP